MQKKRMSKARRSSIFLAFGNVVEVIADVQSNVENEIVGTWKFLQSTVYATTILVAIGLVS